MRLRVLFPADKSFDFYFGGVPRRGELVEIHNLVSHITLWVVSTVCWHVAHSNEPEVAATITVTPYLPNSVV